MKILLVEDELVLRITLGDRLRGEGYVVQTAADGVDALDKIRNLQFDLIILDVELPDVSGFDVCHEIRSACIRTPILFLSAFGRKLDNVIRRQLGADDYLTKPFEITELLGRIDALLRQSHRPYLRAFSS